MPLIRVTHVSHQGLVRLRNEDCIGVFGTDLTWGTPDVQTANFDDRVLIVVADGLGGHPGGDVASHQVVSTLARCAPNSSPELRSAVLEANSSVFSAMKSESRLSGMGSTVASLLINESLMTVANVGDSSVFEIVGGQTLKLSIDDVPKGASQLPGIPKSFVTQVIGGRRTPVSISPHLFDSALESNARFLVCSDGLTNFVSLMDINRVLSKLEGMLAVNELLRLTFEAGAPDNVTIALVEVG